MSLPPERIITGTFVNPVSGEPYDGTDGSQYVVFEPIPDRWTDQGGNQILLGGGKVTLDENGHFSESVVRTDAENVLPETGRLWRLRQYVGGTWDEGVFEVPAGTGALDVTDILSVDICGVDYVPVPGPPGSTGPDGPPGDSAYQTAVDEGFSGTEEEWLESLVGPQGEPGISGGLDTGIATGGDISVNLSNPLAIDVNPLTGQIVDYLADPVLVTPVESTTVLTVELDSVAQERTITWFLMDADLVIYQQEARPGPEDRRNFIVLGLVAQDNGSIFLAQSLPVIARQPVNQLYDLMDAIGAFGITGSDVSPNGANLTLNVGSGQVFSRGWNHFDGPSETNNPHITTTLGATPAPWTHALRSSDLEQSSASAVIDVSHYDNVGTLTPVGGDADTSVVHQLWMFPTNEGAELYILQYGQKTYATLEAAIEAAGKEAYAINPALPGSAINLGFLAVRGQATDLSDNGDGLFIKAGKFGSGPGGGAAVDLSGYAQLSGAEFTGVVASRLADATDLAQSSRDLVSTSDLWRRLASGEMQWGPGTGPTDTFLRRLGVGLLAVINSDLLIGQESAKSYRLRQSGSFLDLDASGADLFLSVFELVNFAGEQHQYLRLESGESVAHASGVWRFGADPDDTSVHTIDGLNNLLGFFGATPAGQRTVTGERTTGAALASLLTGLETLGLVDDTSTAGPDLVETVNTQNGPDVVLTSADVGVGDIVVAASNSRNGAGAQFTCDGTNDEVTIQAAIDLAASGARDGRVRLLDGTFNLSATLEIPDGEGLGFTGSGWGTVLRLANGTDDFAITFSGDETQARFADFTIDGNLAGQTTGPTGGIWAPGAVDCVFEHINFTSCGSSGLFLGPITGGAFGHGNRVTQCLFDNATASTLEGVGIYLDSNDENSITSCDFRSLGGSGPVQGMIHDSAGAQAILGCNFTGGANGRSAVRVQSAAATKIIGCNFDGVGGDAVFLAATDCVVKGNTIFGVGDTGTAGTYSGIHLGSGATGNLIADNSVASSPTNGAARSLIREESAGGSGDNSVIGNMLLTEGTLSVGALDLNAPGTLVRSNFGAGTDGDPVLDISDIPAARSTLGLGTYATRNWPAYVFDVTHPAYGAVGDGKLVVDAAINSGSSTLTCATSSPFVPTDQGKKILVLNAGVSGETITGTIATYVSPTQVTLSVTASTTVTGVPAMFATDDTAAIQAAVDAAVAYALAHSYAATVYFPAAAGAFYGVGGVLKTGGSTLGNSQITLPVVPTTGRKLTLTFQGAQVGSGVQHWEQTLPNTTGSTLVSFGMFASTGAQITSINAAGNAAVIGGPSQPGGYGIAPGVFSNVYFDIGDMSVLTCHSRNGLTYSALDLSGLANAQLRDFAYSTSGTVAPPGASYQNPNIFATGLAIGCLLPANGANDNTILRNVTIGGGYTYGILVTEHTDIYALRILYCWAALCPVGSYFSSVGAAHSIHGTLISIEVCTFLIYIFGPGTGGLGPTMYLKIDTETSTPRFGDRTSGTALLAARGEVTLAGLFTAANLTLDAPTGLKLRNSQLTFPVAAKTATYTATSFDEVILCNAAGGAFTINLPTAVNRTDPVTVKKTDSSGNTITIDGSGSETIDGATAKVLSTQWETVTLIPSGGNWFLI